MIRDIKIIYDELHHANLKNNQYIEVPSKKALSFLLEKSKYLNNQFNCYQELHNKIIELRFDTLPLLFVERYCLDQISNIILPLYPINIAEAFVLSYIVLNKPVNLDVMYFKLGSSNLLSKTIVNGIMTYDIGKIAQFVIKSLSDSKLIEITENKSILYGSQFQIK